MSKRIFVLIVTLMSISLIGIIAVQIYWINTAAESRDKQFSNDVKLALAKTSDFIKEKEIKKSYREFEPFMRNNQFRSKAAIRSYLFQQVDTTGKRKFSFGATILEESFKVPTEDFLDNDSIILKRFTAKDDFFHVKINQNKDFGNLIDENRFSNTNRLIGWEKDEFFRTYNNVLKQTPIQKRISNRELKNILREELRKRNIEIDFKYGVYENGLATPLKSGYFRVDEKRDFSYPLFKDENGESDFKLFVTFPNQKRHILSGITSILLLSVFFIIIIIIAFSSSLYQLIQQKKISEIKTDFINNMTHEFKTPIATINLALDAIKNPKIIQDEEKVKRYVKMIRDENKRMHGQVENVLRISRLEKNQIEISKEAVDAHDIIEEAIEHVSLIVADKKGSITTHFKAITSEVLGNQFHLTNVVVNMLENGIKYSEGAPKIDVFTESTNKYFIFKIKDEGIGMSKSAQKYAFDKFYREHKGNIHNVKGHGLGLAYVKEIVDNHHGIIYVESEKGKGSTFTVKLPLI